jgi:hypothetical protein
LAQNKLGVEGGEGIGKCLEVTLSSNTPNHFLLSLNCALADE